jgi:hypothetical protein
MAVATMRVGINAKPGICPVANSLHALPGPSMVQVLRFVFTRRSPNSRLSGSVKNHSSSIMSAY